MVTCLRSPASPAILLDLVWTAGSVSPTLTAGKNQLQLLWVSLIIKKLLSHINSLASWRASLQPQSLICVKLPVAYYLIICRDPGCPGFAHEQASTQLTNLVIKIVN